MFHGRVVGMSMVCLLHFPIRGFVFVVELSDGRLELSHECFKLEKVLLYLSRTRRFLVRRTKGLSRKSPVEQTR